MRGRKKKRPCAHSRRSIHHRKTHSLFISALPAQQSCSTIIQCARICIRIDLKAREPLSICIYRVYIYSDRNDAVIIELHIKDRRKKEMIHFDFTTHSAGSVRGDNRILRAQFLLISAVCVIGNRIESFHEPKTYRLFIGLKCQTECCRQRDPTANAEPNFLTGGT